MQIFNLIGIFIFKIVSPVEGKSRPTERGYDGHGPGSGPLHPSGGTEPTSFDLRSTNIKLKIYNRNLFNSFLLEIG